jgi:hypothetical protein
LELDALLKRTKSGLSVLSRVAPQGVSPAYRIGEAKRAIHKNIKLLMPKYRLFRGFVEF